MYYSKYARDCMYKINPLCDSPRGQGLSDLLLSAIKN